MSKRVAVVWPLIDAPAFAHRYRAQKYQEQLTRLQRLHSAHCWMQSAGWALLCLSTTTMALLKPPTPGECFCGKTRISLIDADAIVSSSICHCSVCRRLCGAPFCANLLTPRSNVRIDIYGSPASTDALAGLQTSKNVVRYRCTSLRLEPHACNLASTSLASRTCTRCRWPRSRGRIRRSGRRSTTSIIRIDGVMDVRDGRPRPSGRYLLSDEVRRRRGGRFMKGGCRCWGGGGRWVINAASSVCRR